MPMADVYISKGALPDDVERELLSRITDILVDHELRRVIDLAKDAQTVEANRSRARGLAWLFVHRPEIYVAGAAREAPYYKFEIRVPEGQGDDEFRNAVTRDVTAAIVEAEGGKWPNPESRVWVFTWDVPDGTWGALGRRFHLNDIVGWVAPELSHYATDRLAAKRYDEARAIVAAAGAGGDISS
jgi:phenylpyruvate tautomerase PptA (4-oxalocrotonate tautomerase family)